MVLGICGAQGSGKSTVAQDLAVRLQKRGTAVARLSIDDIYLTRAKREELARRVHPLLATRGVPGTHDLALGHQVLDELAEGKAALLPRFDKAADDRAAPERWVKAPERCAVLLFEGWCVGARAQSPDQLAAPANALEAQEDSDCVWRNYVNEALAGPYQRLFARLDGLILLAAPDFETVFDWRMQQERALRVETRETQGSDRRIMDEEQIIRFVQHYERLTRHVLAEMPDRADLVFRLDTARRVVSSA